VFVEVERVEESILATCLTPHHRQVPRLSDDENHSCGGGVIEGSFSTESGQSGLSPSKAITSAMRF